MLHAVPGLDKIFGELLVNAGDSPSLIINRDTTNALIISSDVTAGRQGITPGAPVSVIDPLGSMAVDGTETLYGQGVQASGTITVDVKTGATVWAPPASLVISQLVASSLPGLIATAVQNAGVPPIDMPALIYLTNPLNTDVPAGGTFDTGHISLSRYQSWDIIVSSFNTHNNVDTNPYMRMTMKWSLSTNNFNVVHTEDWVIPVTPFNFTFTYQNWGAGPVYADTLNIIFTSYDTVINTVNLQVIGSFRSRLRSVFRGQYNYNVAGVPQEAPGLGSDAILAAISASNLASGASTSPQLVNLWHGKASLFLSATDAAIDDVECHIQLQPDNVLTNTPDIVLTMDGSGKNTVLSDIDLPRRVCTMFLVNNGSAAIPSIQAMLLMEGVSE